MPFNHFYSASYEKVTVIMPPRRLDIATQNVRFNQLPGVWQHTE
jgi:hypothetical protein